MAKSTGGGGSFTLDGVSIPFNSIEPDVARECDDATDSTDYDVATGITHKSQIPVTTQTTFQVEGKLDLAVIPAAIVAKLFNGATAVPCAIKYNGTATFGHGYVDVTNFKCTIDPCKVLPYSATLISNGKFTPNS